VGAHLCQQALGVPLCIWIWVWFDLMCCNLWCQRSPASSALVCRSVCWNVFIWKAVSCHHNYGCCGWGRNRKVVRHM
jgi:hypothetical protein